MRLFTMAIAVLSATLDIWTEQSDQNFKLLIRAFEKFGIPADAINASDFLSDETDAFTFGKPPVCFETLTSVKGLNFEEAYAHSSKSIYDGVEVNIIDFPDLIKAKKAAERYKDLDDIEHIKK